MQKLDTCEATGYLLVPQQDQNLLTAFSCLQSLLIPRPERQRNGTKAGLLRLEWDRLYYWCMHIFSPLQVSTKRL